MVAEALQPDTYEVPLKRRACPACGAPVRNVQAGDGYASGIVFWCGSFWKRKGDASIGDWKDLFNFTQSQQCRLFHYCNLLEQYGKPDQLKDIVCTWVL